ncbi:MAG: phage tail tape measure protein [Lachnospiraceae bacterium]|nr:phage tail tape measure protein [Lachnospiraceae bacterium]
MAVEIGPRIKVEGEAEYRKQINDIITQAKTLSSEMKKVESSFASEASAIKRSAAERKVLNEQIQVQQKRVEALQNMLDKSRGKFGENASETRKWQQAVNNATTELNKMQQAMKNLSVPKAIAADLKRIGDSVKGVGEKMTSIGRTMTTHVTAPIAAAAAASVKTFIDYESAFAGVRKTVDETEAGFKKLDEGIREMSTRMASSKTDIAGVMEVAGQLGVEGTDNLLKFTETMVMLGDSTNMSAEEAATSLARFLNITGESTANVDRIGSAVVDLGNNFATSETEIVEMSTRLAAAGTIAGLSSTDILALSTAMSSVGINAEAGGTAMSQTLKAMEDNVASFRSGAESDLSRIAEISGMSATQFAEAWETHPIAAVQSFIEGLGNLDAKGESATLVLDELGMSGIRQSNMLKSLALASGELSSAIDISNQAYEKNNALSDEANKRYETTAAQLTQMREKFTNIGLEVAERLMPYIQRLLEFLDGLIQKWDAMSPAMQDNIIKFAAFAAAIGPVVTVVGSIVTAIGGFVGALGTIVAAINPVTVAIGLVIAAGALLIANWDTIKEAGKVFCEEVQYSFNEMKTQLSAAWEQVKTNASQAWEAVKTTISTAWENIKTKVTTTIENVKTTISTKWEEVKTKTTTIWENIKTTVSQKIEEVKTKVSTIMENIKTKVTTILENIKTSFQTKWEEIKTKVTTTVENIKSTVTQRIEEMKSRVDGIVEGLRSAVQSKFDAIKSHVEGVVNWSKGCFNFSWKLPDIKLPHFSVSGGFSINPPSVPHFSVSWYRKAMANGMILNNPTIFGAAGGKLLGAGEAGAEAVVGVNSLRHMIESAVNKAAGAGEVNNSVVINVYGAEGQDVQELADIIEEKISFNIAKRGQVWA